jgi:putative transposase
MAIDDKLLDELLKDYKKPEDLTGEKGLLKQLTKRLVERAMSAEMTQHLGYEKHSPEGKNGGNSRNGYTPKTIRTDSGEIEIQQPRDRDGEFEPQIIKKHQKSFNGFDDKIMSMYSLGMTTRDIQGHIEEIYGVEISPDFISNVTDQIVDDIKEWQNRPLEKIYAIVFLDAIRVKIRENGQVINKAIYLVMGVNLEGMKEVLGMWSADTEGAKFWAMVVSELKNRGVEDIFIACIDGLKGFEEAIAATYPKTQVQLCIVHMIRNSLRFVSWKDRKALATDLRRIYSAPNSEAAIVELEVFRKKWDKKYPSIGEMWQRNWPGIIPFMAYPDYIRKIIYTTNAIESLNHSLRKMTKIKGAFPTDEAARKSLYLCLQNAKKKWKMPIRDWGQALNQFAIVFEGRFKLEQE